MQQLYPSVRPVKCFHARIAEGEPKVTTAVMLAQRR